MTTPHRTARTYTMQLRMSEAEHSRLEQIAKARKDSKSTVLRQLVDRFHAQLSAKGEL